MVVNSNLHVLTLETLPFTHFGRGAESFNAPKTGKMPFFPDALTEGSLFFFAPY